LTIPKRPVSPAAPDSAPRSSRSERRARRQAEIASACAGLFIDGGYETTSIEEVSAALELSAGGLYRYISTKSDLLVMVCEGIYGELPEVLEEFATSDRPYDRRLGSVCSTFLRSCELNRELILLMYREYRHLPKAARRRFKEREEAVVDTFQRLLVEGQEKGLVSRRLPTAVAASDLVLLGHLPALKRWAVPSPEQIVTDQMEVIAQMLGLDDIPPAGEELSGHAVLW
jgi:AcrR family transcriptional regulator